MGRREADMLLEAPTKVSQREITLDVREIEPLLQAPAMGMQHWPGATIRLKDGRTWPEHQHELGGARVYYVTKKYWDMVVKDYVRQMSGADLQFDVPQHIVEANRQLKIPETVAV